MTRIFFGGSSEAWNGIGERIEQLIEGRGLRRVIEIGGGANPTVPLEFVARSKLEYTVLDISQAELDKAPSGYRKRAADICATDFRADGEFDFAFSRMLAEHAANAEVFHRNVHSLLRKGGLAFHFFPTLYAPPFLLNYLLPERLAESLLHLVQPGRESSGKAAKFPARYDWCRGPLRSQIKKFEKVGFDVEEYAGFFGHEPYYRKLPPLHKAHLALSRFLIRHPVPLFTSFAHVLLIRRA